jgi:hypothetical protein
MSLDISGAKAVRLVAHAQCGTFPVNLEVSPIGELSGKVTVRGGGIGCNDVAYDVTGKVTGDSVSVTMNGTGSRAFGTLTKRP